MNPTIILSCAVFLLYLLLLPASPEAMFSDPDTYWHIATGDLIRSLGAIPDLDPWSLSAGEKHWYITSWGWDVAASYFYQHYGWHGVIAMNSATIAATLAVLFATCLLRTNDGVAAFFATLLASACLFDFSVRPHQAGLLFTALLMLLLTHIRNNRLGLHWFLPVPILMMLWANIYGGFIIGFFLLGFFALEALWQKDWHRLSLFIGTGVLSLAACLLNPSGFTLVYDLLNIGNDSSKQLIQEWRSLQFSVSSIVTIFYLFLFFTLVMVRPLKLTVLERWIAYAWLFLGLLSIRHLRIFAIVSAPLLALAIKGLLSPKQPRALPLLAQHFNRLSAQLLTSKRAAYGMLALSLGASLWLFTSSAAKLYQTTHFNPLPDLSKEIAYLAKNYPQARLLNSYNLGGPLIFATHGQIPVFIDGRVGTAYPSHVIDDYIAFHNASPGWEGIFDRYRLDGVIVPNSDSEFIGRFTNRKGWHLAFQGRIATIFLRNTP